MTTIRLLVADDQPLVRAGLRKVVETDPTIEVVESTRYPGSHSHGSS